MAALRDQHAQGWTYSGWMYRIQLAAARAHDPGPVSEGEADERTQRRQVALAETETQALEVGLDPGWIADARAVGAFIGAGGHRIPAGVRPQRTLGAEVFCVDILLADLWHLEQMAALEAASQDLVETGLWEYGPAPDTTDALYEHMDLRYSRAFHAVIGAQITESEGQQLWGPAAQRIRDAHAASVAAMSPTEVHDHWQMHAVAQARLRVPNLPTDPDTGKLVWQLLTEPPAPATMIAAAAHARAVHLSGNAAPPPVIADIGVDPATAADPVIGPAVDAALPGNTGTRWEPDHGGQPPPQSPDRSVGADLDAGWSS